MAVVEHGDGVIDVILGQRRPVVGGGMAAGSCESDGISQAEGFQASEETDIIVGRAEELAAFEAYIKESPVWLPDTIVVKDILRRVEHLHSSQWQVWMFLAKMSRIAEASDGGGSMGGAG
jgi:hypothetical protein